MGYITSLMAYWEAGLLFPGVQGGTGDKIIVYMENRARRRLVSCEPLPGCFNFMWGQKGAEGGRNERMR
jgi:hypothetical protein